MSNIDNKYQSNFDTALFGLSLDRGADAPLHVQLAEALRGLILSSRDASGLRLPSGRVFAQELSVSRMTVTTAFDQLTSEGYLSARRGSGTYVAEHLPHLTTPARRRPAPTPESEEWLPFQSGLPDPKLFPHRLWARHLERAWRKPVPGLLGQPDPFGWYPLRAAICEHLSVWRGLACHPQQILITAGATEAIQIICQVLLERHQSAVIEDPGWHPLRATLAKAGIRQVPIRIDDHGLNAADLPDDVSAAFVTPARHYPTGKVMPLARRLALLERAAQQGVLIVEDDYDSEFRYIGQPLPSMAGLDGLKTTIYLGSFSKLLSPALRIGYMVLPEPLVPRIGDHIAQAMPLSSLVPQPALAEMMLSGEFATHLRRMRRTYAKRQACLIGALEGALDILDVQPDASGMHLCCRLRPDLPTDLTDTALSAIAAEEQVSARALSAHAVLPDPPQGLLLGYAAFEEKILERAAHSLTEILLKTTIKD